MKEKNKGENKELLSNPSKAKIVPNKPSVEEVEKIYELTSDEYKRTYLIKFENRKKRMRFIVSEKDLFPANVYENSLTMEELLKLNKWFSNFEDIKKLFEEIKNLSFEEKFNIKLITKKLMKLIIEFPEDKDKKINQIEINLNKKNIDDREMLSQIYEKYKYVQKLHDDDLKKFKERMRVIEEKMEALKPPEGEEENKDKESINEAVDNKNIEQMKNELKEEVKNLVREKSNNKLKGKGSKGRGKGKK